MSVPIRNKLGLYASLKVPPSGEFSCCAGAGYVSRPNFSWTPSQSAQFSAGSGSTDGWVGKITGSTPVAGGYGVTGSFTLGPNGWSMSAGPTLTNSSSATATYGYNYTYHP